MYSINEIFYSLQGEGFWSGTPMIFVRFSGCNLKCPFCDTDHSMKMQLSPAALLAMVRDCGGDCRRICLTGGEPALQVDAVLVELLHSAGYTLHIETNGTKDFPEGIDWITVSPKTAVFDDNRADVVLKKADELKLVYTPGCSPALWEDFPAPWHFLQPCSMQNTAEVINYILSNPLWHLSLQTHKYLDIR